MGRAITVQDVLGDVAYGTRSGTVPPGWIWSLRPGTGISAGTARIRAGSMPRLVDQAIDYRGPFSCWLSEFTVHVSASGLVMTAVKQSVNAEDYQAIEPAGVPVYTPGLWNRRRVVVPLSDGIRIHRQAIAFDRRGLDQPGGQASLILKRNVMRDMMKLVNLDPPGTFCNYAALRDVIRRTGGRTFLDIGCGSGRFSSFLLGQGLDGFGVDFSEVALKRAEEELASSIEAGRYRLIAADFASDKLDIPKVDLAIAYMVIEHVDEDEAFVRRMAEFVHPGGYVIIAVPGRRDKWCLEDETVGHLRRYDRCDLKSCLENAGLVEATIWSLAVPVSNMLFSIGNRLIARSDEIKKTSLDQEAQSKHSGLQEVPWKTLFPGWCRIILNRFTMYPFYLIQRGFYDTDLGVTVLGFGRVP